MKQQKTVTVEIDPQGNTTVTTSGFAGATCKQATTALENALGTVTSDDKTPEFFQGAACSLPQQAKAGQ